jgi:uncharacterized membrane protein
VTQHWEKNRVEAFSDGVFAIAITLLVLEISIAPEQYDHLWHALGQEWPAYLAYVTSFLTVGSVWIAHHQLFTYLRYVDPVLLRLNLLLLMAAAFLPFPTGVLAQALHHSNEAERAAIVFYGATAIVIELLLQACIRYGSSRPELLIAEVPGASPRDRGRPSISSALYVAAIIVGILTFPKLAAVGYLVVAFRGVVVAGAEGQLNLSSLFGRR